MKLNIQYTVPLDSPERTLLHREIILSKPFLNRLYREWYSCICEELKGLPSGKLVELGSGGGFLKEIVPSVICSDILLLPTNDLTFSALDMPFEDGSVSALIMVDTFHHLPDAGRFLHEAGRVLKDHGKIIMVEPANTMWGRFIYRNFHHEPFDPAGGWQIPVTGPLSGANGALPWIVFERDKERFRKEFPGFIIEKVTFHTPLRYLLSGGVSFKQQIGRAHV